jgi:hypothetical protein
MVHLTLLALRLMGLLMMTREAGELSPRMPMAHSTATIFFHLKNGVYSVAHVTVAGTMQSQFGLYWKLILNRISSKTGCKENHNSGVGLVVTSSAHVLAIRSVDGFQRVLVSGSHSEVL